MPTVLRFDGLRVVIYPNDHRPAHVHVIGAGCEATFVLNCPGGPPQLAENYGFKPALLSSIGRRLTAELALLCREWNDHHGD
jgi:hypothetical protein